MVANKHIFVIGLVALALVATGRYLVSTSKTENLINAPVTN